MNIRNITDVIKAGGHGSGCHGPNCGRPKGHSGPHGPAISDAADDFVQSWTFGAIGKPRDVAPSKPSADVLVEMKKFQTDEPMLLYRSHLSGTPSDDMQSWTTSREMARSLTEDFGENNRVLLTRRVDPSEVIFWGKKYNELVGDESVIAEEVVVANGRYAQQVAKARGQTLVRGQQWNVERKR